MMSHDCGSKSCESFKVPKQTLKDIYLDRKKTTRETRDAFVERFRWKKTSTQKEHSARRFFTKYRIGRHQVCQRHLCIPKTRGQKPNDEQNHVLEDFFEKLPKERSHYCLHSKDLFIQGFSKLLLLFHEFQRQNPLTKLSRSKFCSYFKKEVLSLHQKKLHAVNDCEWGRFEAELEHHQLEARLEENLQVGFNQVLKCISADSDFSDVSNLCLRIDADPAANISDNSLTNKANNCLPISKLRSVSQRHCRPCLKLDLFFLVARNNGPKRCK